MRAGQTISQAMQSVADDFSSPVADEFGYCCDQQNLGLSPESSLHALARRTGIMEIKIFVLAVMVHRQSGGNLAELLDKLSTVIRERDRIRRDMQALTAEGRMQMLILLALPPMFLLALYMLNRPYVSILFDYPSLLWGTATTMLVGALAMQSIINFEA
jgi:tight adherence protein B